MRRTVALALLAAIGLAGTAAGAAAPTATKATSAKPTAYLADVNGTRITRQAFLSRLEAMYGQDVLTEMINEATVRQEAAAQKVSVAEKAIKDSMERGRAQFKTPEELTAALTKYHLTEETWKQQLWMGLALEQLGAPPAPTEEQLKAHFDKNLARYDQVEEVKVRHILVKAEDEGKAVLAELSAGGDFAKLAAKHSVDTGSKDKGGEVGYAKKGQLVPEFETVAFALQPGETSSLVKTDFGYHIIQLVDHRKPKKAEYAAARDAVVKDWKAANTVKPQDVVTRLRAKYAVKVSSDRYKALANDPSKGPAVEGAAAKK